MQYETIILEMMGRIQKLEEEVKELRVAMEAGSAAPIETQFKPAETQPKKNVKVTPEMTRLCYEKAKAVYRNPYLDTNDLANEVSAQTGMNFDTAKMNIYSITQLLKGEEYKRLLSADSLDMCLEMISNEFGQDGLEKALTAVKLHISYLKTIGNPAWKLQNVYNKYKNRIK